MLPCTLTHLRFGSSPMFGGGFNQPLTAGMLPHGLTELAFGFDFNQPVAKGVLPGTLTHLTFGYHFNQPVPIRATCPNPIFNRKQVYSLAMSVPTWSY